MKLIAAVLLLCCLPLPARSQEKDTYSRRNTFAVFAEYSNDSSHIFLGVAPNRKFAGVGLQYERRLIRRHGLAWSYLVEARPVIFESDPIAYESGTLLIPPQNGNPAQTVPFRYGPEAIFRCTAGTVTYTGSGANPIQQTTTTTCSRDWNYAQSLSPIGTRLNLLTHRRLQPTVSGSLGYMFSTHPIPLDDAGSFNFVFELGAGMELYRATRRSVRLEYQLQHFSNKGTAAANPGVDNGMLKFTYCFGR